MQRGILSKIFDYFTHAVYSEGTPLTWFAFFILALMASLLWSTVVREIVDAPIA